MFVPSNRSASVWSRAATRALSVSRLATKMFCTPMIMAASTMASPLSLDELPAGTSMIGSMSSAVIPSASHRFFTSPAVDSVNVAASNQIPTAANPAWNATSTAVAGSTSRIVPAARERVRIRPQYRLRSAATFVTKRRLDDQTTTSPISHSVADRSRKRVEPSRWRVTQHNRADETRPTDLGGSRLRC